MKYQNLLHLRSELLRQVRLANAAYAHERLSLFAERIARAGLCGVVTLQPGDAADEAPWPRLVAEKGSQAQLDEYFLDEDVVELADIFAFLAGDAAPTAHTFRLEDLAGRILPGLRRELERAGVDLGPGSPHPEDSTREVE